MKGLDTLPLIHPRPACIRATACHPLAVATQATQQCSSPWPAAVPMSALSVGERGSRVPTRDASRGMHRVNALSLSAAPAGAATLAKHAPQIPTRTVRDRLSHLSLRGSPQTDCRAGLSGDLVPCQRASRARQWHCSGKARGSLDRHRIVPAQPSGFSRRESTSRHAR